MDDILETFFMNMINKGELSTMIPKLKYDNYPVTIIRPLCYAAQERIIEHAQKKGFMGFVCTCDFQDNSDRKDARKKIEMLTGGDINTKERIFNALKNVNTNYLP